MQISEFLCDLFGFDDGSSDKTDFAVELFRLLNRLVQTGNIGRIGSNKNLSLTFTHSFFKILREHLFRRSKSGSFSRQYTELCVKSESGILELAFSLQSKEPGGYQ